MHSVPILVLVLALTGCGAGETKLAFNRFTIDAGYGTDTSYFEAVAELTEKAEGLCDEGYRKLHDYDTSEGDDKLLVWEVACKGTDRSDQVYIKQIGSNAP